MSTSIYASRVNVCKQFIRLGGTVIWRAVSFCFDDTTDKGNESWDRQDHLMSGAVDDRRVVETLFEVGHVEAFLSKIKRCRLDKGIMVSFTGCQAGAIAEAKMSNIGLYNFRPCEAEDLDGAIAQIDFEFIIEEPVEINLRVETKISSLSLSEEEKGIVASRPIIAAVNDDVYDEYGNRIGGLHEVVSRMLEKEVLTQGKRAGVLRSDWSSRQIHMHSDWNGEKLVRRVLSIEVVYNAEKKPISSLN